MDLISKKELLELTGISYGQLYRWKRERLIPEEWFIKRASFTGQETFFPRSQILPRVQAILDNKDKYSLTELSKMLSPDTAPALIDSTALAQIEEIAPDLLPAILYCFQKESYELFDLALFAAISQAETALGIQGDERRDVVELCISTAKLRQLDSVLTVFLVGGAYHALMTKADSPLVFDSTIQTGACTVSISEAAAAIKVKYRALVPTL
ncbi:MAG: YhbD family protein [Ruminococcus bromii]|nr:YhbD family protein [Ruminococcus bromii]